MTQIYAMDTHFHTPIRSYPWDARFGMLADLGYDAIHVSTQGNEAFEWHELDRLDELSSRHGVTVTGVHGSLDLVTRGACDDRFLEVARRLPRGGRLEVSLTSADEADFDPASPAAAARLHELLDATEANGADIALYFHVRHKPAVWLFRLDQAVALARQFDHPRLGVVFSGFHWFAQPRDPLPTALRDAAPYLKAVNLSGSTITVDGTTERYSIETIDRGVLDNFAVLGQLRAIGYTGPVGFQGFSVGGDVYANLRRNLDAYHDMQQRLDAHPDWAEGGDRP